LGFYKTYLIHFPTFEGFATVHHFHGLLALTWILMLISQAYLIRNKKYTIHKAVGKLSFIVMPLFIISLFLVAKESYFRNSAKLTEAEALAALTNGLPDMFFFSILFILAMVNKRNSSSHMRYMTSTGIMMLGPGLGRFMIVFCGLPFPVVIITMILLTLGVAIVWFIFDYRNKKSLMPMSVLIMMSIVATLIQINANGAIWQSFAAWFASNFF
jgi:hypothetical protein